MRDADVTCRNCEKHIAREAFQGIVAWRHVSTKSWFCHPGENFDKADPNHGCA